MTDLLVFLGWALGLFAGYVALCLVLDAAEIVAFERRLRHPRDPYADNPTD